VWDKLHFNYYLSLRAVSKFSTFVNPYFPVVLLRGRILPSIYYSFDVRGIENPYDKHLDGVVIPKSTGQVYEIFLCVFFQRTKLSTILWFLRHDSSPLSSQLSIPQINALQSVEIGAK
jgi:hypothetical protein